MKQFISALLLTSALAFEGRELAGFPSSGAQFEEEKSYPPEAYLLSPRARRMTNSTNMHVPPCGGTEPNGAHFIATPGSKNYFVWKVNHPSPKGNCTLRISSGTEDDGFTILAPLDGSANKKGAFPCGRVQTVNEGKEVRFPNISCDACVVQWEWSTHTGKQFMCAEVAISGNEAEDCAGRCLNGGVCSNGVCKCRSSFSGSNCQYKETKETSYFYLFVFYLVMIVIIAALFVGAIFLMKHAQKKLEEMR